VASREAIRQRLASSGHNLQDLVIFYRCCKNAKLEIISNQ
jgi:hypothetical protein